MMPGGGMGANSGNILDNFAQNDAIRNNPEAMNVLNQMNQMLGQILGFFIKNYVKLVYNLHILCRPKIVTPGQKVASSNAFWPALY